MNDNPYNAPKAFAMESGSVEEPVVKNYALHILKKSFVTLLFGIILAAFNFIGGTFLAIVCTSSIGYIPDFFPHSLTFIIVELFFLNILITPAFALTICWMALSDEKPLSWCKRNLWLFLIAFAIPFTLFSYMSLAGAANA